jgi:hypothetical protein
MMMMGSDPTVIVTLLNKTEKKENQNRAVYVWSLKWEGG